VGDKELDARSEEPIRQPAESSAKPNPALREKRHSSAKRKEEKQQLIKTVLLCG